MRQDKKTVKKSNLPEEISEEEMMRILSQVRTQGSPGLGALALNDIGVLSEVWEMYLDSEALLEEIPTESVVRRVKLAISKIAGAFSLEDQAGITANALTPLPALRSASSEDDHHLLSVATFRFAEPKIPGCIFNLEIKSIPNGTGFYWQTNGIVPGVLYLKLYVNRQLQGMQNVSASGAEFLLPSDLNGKIHFEAELAGQKNISLFEFEM